MMVSADKGFINAKVAEELMAGGLRLITKVRKDKKSNLPEMTPRLLLVKRWGGRDG